MAKPLLDIHCSYEPGCEYPPDLFVNMDDGTVQTYDLRNKNEYKFRNVIESLEKFTVGYQYKQPEKRKRRVHN